MRLNCLLIMATACVISGTGCSQLGPLYHKPEQGFSFYPPAGWRYNPPEEEITIFQSHHIKGCEFRPNLNIVVENTDLALEEYVENSKNRHMPKLPGFEIIEEDYLRYGEVWRMIYDHLNPRYNVKLRSLLQLFMRGRTVYAVTCTAPAALWDGYGDMFIDVLDNFRFGEEAKPIGGGVDPYRGPEIGEVKG